MSETAFLYWEWHGAHPKVEFVQRIADAQGLNADELMNLVKSNRANKRTAFGIGDATVVAEVKLALSDLCLTKVLPTVCVRCGRKATGFRGIRLTSSEPKRPSFWVSILWQLGFLTLEEKTSVENIMHEFAITKGRLNLPVCRWHRWIVPPFIGVQMVNDRTVVLSHVSDSFATTIKGRGWAR
jgi:hypothetical protein